MKKQFHESLVLSKLRNKEISTCFKSNLSCPRVIEIAGITGYDCVWVCEEHVANSSAIMESQILAAKSRNIDLVVRVARGSYSELIRPLEQGASGIMVPHVMSEKDAKEIVKNCRFFPIGLRPLDGGNRDGDYCLTSLNEYIKNANNEKFIILQIEDKEAMEELDAICNVDGVDIIFFGPGDYSQSIGKTGDLSNKEIVDARRKVANSAKKAGKFAGTVLAGATYDELLEEGFDFICMGSDVIALGEYCKNILSDKINKTKQYQK